MKFSRHENWNFFDTVEVVVCITMVPECPNLGFGLGSKASLYFDVSFFKSLACNTSKCSILRASVFFDSYVDDHPRAVTR